MKKLITFMIIVALCKTAFSQETTKEEQKYTHALGIAAGFTTGYGMAYRYMPSDFSFQLTFAPYKDSNSALISAGLTFMYDFIKTESISLFVYQGNHFRYRQEEMWYNNIYDDEINREYLFNNGIGFGLEFALGKYLVLDIMGGYGAYRNFEAISLTGETGLFYRF